MARATDESPDDDDVLGAELPDAARAAVIRDLKKRAKDRGFWTPLLKAAPPDRLEICRPHRIAFLPLRTIERDASLRLAAQILGWRFLIRIIGQAVPIAAAHAIIDPKTGKYRLSELNEGRFVAGTEDIFRRAPPLVQTGRERLLLIVPSVYVAAIWFRERKGEDDLVQAIPIPPQLFPNRAENPQEFFKILTPLAERVPDSSALGG